MAAAMVPPKSTPRGSSKTDAGSHLIVMRAEA